MQAVCSGGGRRSDHMQAKHDHWTDCTCIRWGACRMLNLSSSVENRTSESIYKKKKLQTRSRCPRQQCCFRALGRNTKRLSRNACDSGSVWTMLTVSKSPKSTYLPATMWLTVFTRIGEKPGPNTNDCWSSSPKSTLATKELSLSNTGTEAPAKNGTVKLAKPWGSEGKVITCCSRKSASRS